MGKTISKNSEPPMRQFWLRGFFQAGKSSIVYRLKHGEVCQDEMRLRYYEGHESFDHKEDTIMAFDSNGGRQPEGRLVQLSFMMYESIVFVIDSTDPDNIERSMEELNDYYFPCELLANKVIMVLANKQDLENAISAEDMEKKIQARSIKFGITVFVMPTSAETGEGLDLAFKYFWTLMDLKKQKLLKPGLLRGAWKKAEKQLASNDFDDICLAKKIKQRQDKEKKKHCIVKAIKNILNY